MKVLFDTNVIMDVLLDRQPHAVTAVALLAAVEQDRVDGYLCANSVTTIDYLITKTLSRVAAGVAVRNLLSLFAVAEVNRTTLLVALDLGFGDFEDAVLYQSGLAAGVDAVVTRNGRDFKQANLPIYSPGELYGLLLPPGY